MFQPDLFAMPTVMPGGKTGSAERPCDLDMTMLLDRLTRVSMRPRYSFMVLTLIERVADAKGAAGPWVETDAGVIPIRDWLTDALLPVAQRDPRRMAVAAEVRRDLERRGALPDDPQSADLVLQDQIRVRVRKSGRTNISRAVSELVQAGLVRRHYQGYRVDHLNRGGQRNAVYTIVPEARKALARAGRR